MRSILGRQQYSDTIAGVDEGATTQIRLKIVGPGPVVNIHQNRPHWSSVFGARAVETRRPITSKISQ